MKKNTIEKQKTALVVISLIALIIGIGMLVGGVLLIVFGAKNISDKETVSGVIKLILGIGIAILSLFVGWFGIQYLWISSALKATKGSIAEGNVAKAGTINMKKCKNCGSEVHEGDLMCPNCGHSLSDKLICPKCGATNMSENKKCSACGTDLE